MAEFRNTVTATLFIPDTVEDDGSVPKGTNITEYPIPEILRITGNVRKTSLAYPNQGIIEIFNLSEEYRTLISSRKARIQLKGGLVGSEILFFEGSIRNAIHTRNDLDIVTTVYIGDNQRSWDTAILNKAYKNSHSLQSILTDLGKALPSVQSVSFEKAPNFVEKNLMKSNITVNGSVRDSLSRLIKAKVGEVSPELTYSIQGDELIFADASGIITAESEVTINQVGQIIGIPNVDAWALTLTTLFDTSIQPYQTLTVDSQFVASNIGNLFFVNQQDVALNVSGQKRIREVVHNFDTRGADWKTTIKASVN